MSTDATIAAKILMNSDFGQFVEKVEDHNFQASFASDGTWTVTPAQFGQVVIPDIDTGNPLLPKVTLRVQLRKTALGHFNAAGGALEISASFEFHVALANSVLGITLGQRSFQLPMPAPTPTKQVSGQPISSASGDCRVAAKGTFVGGHLDGANCLVQLSGTFVPKPW